MGACHSSKKPESVSVPVSQRRTSKRRSSEEEMQSLEEELVSYIESVQPARVRRASAGATDVTAERNAAEGKNERGPDDDIVARVGIDFIERRASAAASQPRSEEPVSIGTSIIESGRASVRRNSLPPLEVPASRKNSLAVSTVESGHYAKQRTPVNSPTSSRSSTESSGRKSSALAGGADGGAAGRREARRARFAATIEQEPLATSAPAPATPRGSGGSPRAVDEPTDVVTSLVAHRRSVRRASIPAAPLPSPPPVEDVVSAVAEGHSD